MVLKLIQAWQIIDRRAYRLVKALLIIVFALLIGTLPFIDNFANIGGFVFGVPLAIVFLPYITFG